MAIEPSTKVPVFRLILWEPWSSLSPPFIPVAYYFSCSSFCLFKLTRSSCCLSCWVIHLYRPSSSSSSTNIIASKAAACIARHFEDLLQNVRSFPSALCLPPLISHLFQGMVLGTPQFGTTALFAAMGQLVWDRKFESESSMKQIGASQLAILALAAKELSTAYVFCTLIWTECLNANLYLTVGLWRLGSD